MIHLIIVADRLVQQPARLRLWWILLLCLSLTGRLVQSLSVGIDLGTSGVRSCLVDSSKTILHQTSLRWTSPEACASPEEWVACFQSLILDIPINYRSLISSICVSGTSASVLVYDEVAQKVTRKTRMYNFNVMDIAQHGAKAMQTIISACPADSVTAAPTSTLAKLLSWHYERPLSGSECLVHQADYVSNYITSEQLKAGHITSDWHNALKLGYDVHSLQYPAWLLALLKQEKLNPDLVLPKVIQPGHEIGKVRPTMTKLLGLSSSVRVIAG